MRPVTFLLRAFGVAPLALATAGCLGETTLLTPPRPPATTISLTFTADSEDLATATALGWAAGIPNVAVTVTSQDSSSPPQHLQGSAAGAVTLNQLAGGKYVVDAARWLTDAERAQLPAGDDAVGFVGRIYLNTASADANNRLQMVASRRHGLVISEFKDEPLFTAQEGTYLYSGYLRLFNNGDSTVYLDGLIIGSGLAAQFGYPNFPCSYYSGYSEDSRGIWYNRAQQLPGHGTDYPLRPGETALVAADAIDHRPLFSEGLDLRAADFEFYAGGGDVDNPDVPNAPEVGPQSDPGGHGLVWSSLGKVAFLARPYDLTTVRSVVIVASTWARVPGDVLLDVVTMKTTYQTAYPECVRLVNSSFDRQTVQLLGARPEDDLLAYRRRQVPLTIAGHAVLQDTRTSAWDFTAAARAPFAVP
jgi:hypothetical protein